MNPQQQTQEMIDRLAYRLAKELNGEHDEERMRAVLTDALPLLDDELATRVRLTLGLDPDDEGAR